MPRDSSAVYSLPNGYLATTGETVLASQHNTPLEDIAQALTGSLPRNGTGAMQAALPMGGFRITGLGSGTADTDAATFAQVTALQFPLGAIIDYAGTTAPTGWLLCYGQAVSRTTYAALFAIIGTTFGAGDASTTFNLPDLRGRVVAGKDNMGGTSANRLTDQSGGLDGDTLGDTGGSETHVLTSAELAAHTHAISGATESDGSHYHGVYSGDATSGSTFGLASAFNRGLGGGDNLGTGAYRYVTGGGPQAIETAGAHTHDIDLTSGSTGSGTAHNNVQPTIILNKIIKALAS